MIKKKNTKEIYRQRLFRIIPIGSYSFNIFNEEEGIKDIITRPNRLLYRDIRVKFR